MREHRENVSHVTSPHLIITQENAKVATTQASGQMSHLITWGSQIASNAIGTIFLLIITRDNVPAATQLQIG